MADPAATSTTEALIEAAVDARMHAILPQVTTIIQETLKAEGITTTATKIAPPKPPRFSGRLAEAEGWLFTVETYFKATSITDPLRVTYAATLLEGRAALWWRSIADDPDAPTTWDAFKSELMVNFVPVDSTKEARRRLRFLRQRTSVAAYTAEFTKACLEIPGITEDEKMDRFLAGLKPALQRELGLREPKTMKEMTTLAHRLDHLDFASRYRPTSDPRPHASSHHSTPMELGAISHGPSSSRGTYGSPGAGPSKPTGARPKQTPEERERLRQEGKCFYCKERGHIADRCPNKPGNEKRAGKRWVRH